MVKDGSSSYEKFEGNVDAPIKLKSKIAYNIATMENK
jgi:hypothetical protein